MSDRQQIDGVVQRRDVDERQHKCINRQPTATHTHHEHYCHTFDMRPSLCKLERKKKEANNSKKCRDFSEGISWHKNRSLAQLERPDNSQRTQVKKKYLSQWDDGDSKPKREAMTSQLKSTIKTAAEQLQKAQAGG